ncbi:hypothetical protein MCEMRE195_00045 [Candidatus Nanopelagicaceae bacterium]
MTSLRYIPAIMKFMPKTLTRNKEFFSYGILLSAVLIANLIASLWNVDPYHEGAIFPTATGLAQGLNVFDGVSQQYGFLLPLVISPFLKVFGTYLFVSRLVSFVLLILLTFLTYKVSCIYMNRKVAFYASLLWLSVSPIWSYTMFGRSLSGGAWPNHLAMILVLLSILLISNSRAQTRSISVSSAAFLTFLSSQARMEFFLVWFFISLFLLMRDRKIFFYWIIGSTLAILTIFSYLLSNSAVDDWFNQTIKVWTLDAPDVPTIGLGFFFWNGLNFVALAAILPLTLLLYHFLQFKLSSLVRIFVLVVFLIFLTSVSQFLPDSISILGRNVATILDFAAQRTLFSYVNVVILSSLIIGFVAVFRRTQKRKHPSSGIDLLNGILWCTAIGILGVFHNTNADYTSITVAPFLILTLGYFFPASSETNPRLISILKEYVAAVVTVSLVIFCLHFPKQVHEYDTPVLKNLYAQNLVEAKNLDARFHQIAKHTGNSRFLMDCQIGMLSVNERGFQGLDKWTWNQQPAIMIANRLQNLESGDYAVTCHLNEEDLNFLKSEEGLQKFSIEFADGDFSILKVN